jgi:hypothetical protein
MTYFPFRAHLNCFLFLFIAAVPFSSIAQTNDSYLDSLYTYSYLKHRLHLCKQKFDIPGPDLRALQAAASIADSLAKRWTAEPNGPDAFLPYWAAHPELDEDGARAKFGQPRPAPGNCTVDSNGYSAARKRLTELQLSVYKKEQSGDTLAAIALLDSINRQFPFTGSIIRAKRLAISSRDTAAYLRILAQGQYSNMAEARLHEMSWSVATTPAKKAFVAAALRQMDSNAMLSPRKFPRDIERCLVSYSDLQSICSDCIFKRSKTPPFLRAHKDRLRQIYCFMIEESYTATPVVLCRYLNTPDSISLKSLFLLSYLNLHLIQLNAFGQIYPDSFFENYFNFLRQLAYAGAYDMEDCDSLRDEYLTAVKRMPTEFGYVARPKGYDLEYDTEPSDEVRARREAKQLLPLEVADAIK